MIDKVAGLFSPHPYSQDQPWEKHWAAVGLIFQQISSNDLELLFIERATHPDDAWSGHMAFPGGRSEPGESILQTVRRECYEEIGICLDESHARLLGYLAPHRAMKQGQWQNFSLIPVGFLLHSHSQKLKLDPTEVASTCWLNLNWLFDRANHTQFSYAHQTGEILLPCIPLEQNKIWGLTYKVLDELQIRMES